MGQPINVVEKPSRTPGIARFETNRSFTGMGHERYPSAEAIVDDRAVDELARRLFATGGVTWVHVNGSVITVALADGWAGEQLLDVIRGLYIHYPQATTSGASAPVSEVSGSPGEEVQGGDTAPTSGADDDSEAGVDAEPDVDTVATESDARQ